MCIAIIKPAGIKMPSRDILKHCFETNPDGAGVAYSDGSVFKLRKGLMTFGEVEDYLDTIPAAALDATTVALHFRIGTHGSKRDPLHTHPFPVSTNRKDLFSLDIETKRIAMHNGIMSSWGKATSSSYYADKEWDSLQGKYIEKKSDPNKEHDESDTQEFIRKFVAVLQEAIGDARSIWDEKGLQRLIGREVGTSRFTIIEPDGRYLYWGDWIEHDGCLYSNAGFKVPKKEADKSAEAELGTKKKNFNLNIYTFQKGITVASTREDVDKVCDSYFMKPIYGDVMIYDIGSKKPTFSIKSDPDTWLYADIDYGALYTWDKKRRAFIFLSYFDKITHGLEGKRITDDVALMDTAVSP